jgi:hypothetical protein
MSACYRIAQHNYKPDISIQYRTIKITTPTGITTTQSLTLNKRGNVKSPAEINWKLLV